VYAVDTQAQRLRGPITKRISLGGGGGTDMAAGVEAALTMRPSPDLVVVITDGLTPWPRYRPRCPVIVALLPTPPTRPETPPWARVVALSDPAA